MTIQLLRQRLEQSKGMRLQVEKSLTLLTTEIIQSKRSLRRHEQAREIVREVGLKTQQQLQFHISDITSVALDAVFDDPYALQVEFVQRRNKTECDLYFVRNDEKTDPLSASGGGVVDVTAFALRIASWSMTKPRTMNVMILDEPFKHLKGANANQRVLNIINEISKKLKIQIIMVSDERISREDIVASAERVFEVSINNRKSKVEVI